MPEVHFHVRWPDGSQRRYYSPSRAVREQLRAGESYPVTEFLTRVATAMRVASARVRAKFGYECSSAADTLNLVQNYAQTLSADELERGQVTVESFEGP